MLDNCSLLDSRLYKGKNGTLLLQKYRDNDVSGDVRLTLSTLGDNGEIKQVAEKSYVRGGAIDKWVNGSALTGDKIRIADKGHILWLEKSSGETWGINCNGCCGSMSKKSVFEFKDFCKKFGPRGEVAFKKFAAFVEKMCKR